VHSENPARFALQLDRLGHRGGDSFEAFNAEDQQVPRPVVAQHEACGGPAGRGRAAAHAAATGSDAAAGAAPSARPRPARAGAALPKTYHMVHTAARRSLPVPVEPTDRRRGGPRQSVIVNIRGSTALIAHVGFPTHAFKAPMIYNPYFEQAGIDAVVVPMGCRPEHYAPFLRALATVSNLRGVLVTMPHKVTTVALLDEASSAVRIAGACNAVRPGPDGRLVGEMFDGEGFTRGLRRKGCTIAGARALVVGAGGVGSAIAASLAAAGVAAIGLHDARAESARALGARIAEHYPQIEVRREGNDPAGWDIVVNATPLGMNDGDPLPLDVARLDPGTFVGEVVMKSEMTAFLRAAQARGCRFQVGTDMLFEQIPAYLEFFGMPTTTAEHLRSVARLSY
jgi:shikimate dehydrogenase